MLQRKAKQQIDDWMQSNNKTALLVYGARQVGKTYLIRAAAEEAYETVLEINFIERSELADIFTQARGADDILMRLSLLSRHPLVSGKTLIFFDEIQECKEVATAIKFLVDDGRFSYALSGSLLGVELEDIRSVPVGYLTEIVMYPLDFEEFCWSQGVELQVFPMLRESVAQEHPIDSFVHARMQELFDRWLIVGGMPAAVNAFTGDDLSGVRTAQSNIRKLYRRDISKYAPKDRKLEIRELYDLIPSELNKPNKRFFLSKIDIKARFSGYEHDFAWLVGAGVALPAYNVSEPCAPLLASKQRNLFKLFSSDVGLLTSAYTRATSLALLAGKTGVNNGSLYENAVAQELVAHGFSLFYLNSKKHGELDFVVQDADDRVLPIEVKSGKDYRRHRALANVLDCKQYHLDRGYVFGPGNIERKGKVLYAPVYMAGLLEAN